MSRYDGETALIVVDVQNDFADPEGSLYVPGGEEVVPIVNREVDRAHATRQPSRGWGQTGRQPESQKNEPDCFGWQSARPLQAEKRTYGWSDYRERGGRRYSGGTNTICSSHVLTDSPLGDCQKVAHATGYLDHSLCIGRAQGRVERNRHGSPISLLRAGKVFEPEIAM